MLGKKYTEEELLSYIGEKKNNLTLIKYKGQDKNYKYKYDMQCDCGNVCKDGDFYNWKSGIFKMCKKCSSDIFWNEHRKYCTDLTGAKIGRLTVIKRGDDRINKDGRHHRQWWCMCDCQNYLPDKDRQLVLKLEDVLTRKNNTQSCGCLQKETLSRIIKKYNNFIEKENYYIGLTDKNEEFYFDKDVYEEIKNFCWYITNDGYVRTNDPRSYHCFLHRVVTKCPEDFEVDHIHGRATRNDNRKDNLRIATRKENSRNVGMRPNNKSGITGVSWSETYNEWIAQIGVDNKTISLGHSSNFENMVELRKNAEDLYFGEFSYDNSMHIGKEHMIYEA